MKQIVEHARQICRTFSRSVCESKPKRTVYISSSNDIFDNLALEEWLYENADLSSQEYLLMWRNKPAIVIGRHQNPWTECNLQETRRKRVMVARRNSGGGTVFHDEGNLNFSFLKNRSHYDRRRNLSLVAHALTTRWNLDLDLNARDDLILDGVYKVSGTASKLGREKTYHHFTLMMDVDTASLRHMLQTSLVGVESKATRSVPAVVKNLKEYAPEMTAEKVFHVIAAEFLDGQAEREKSVQLVDPQDEGRFTGILSIKNRLMSWEWIYGKTPPFTITRTFVKTPTPILASTPSDTSSTLDRSAAAEVQEVVMQASSSFSNPEYTMSACLTPVAATRGASVFSNPECFLTVCLTIQKGRVEQLSAELSSGCSLGGNNLTLQSRLLGLVQLKGEPLESSRMEEVWGDVSESLQNVRGDIDYTTLDFGVECLKECLPCPGFTVSRVSD